MDRGADVGLSLVTLIQEYGLEDLKEPRQQKDRMSEALNCSQLRSRGNLLGRSFLICGHAPLPPIPVLLPCEARAMFLLASHSVTPTRYMESQTGDKAQQ